MFEGAQGTLLDIDHGTYPFVTSSSATAGGAVTGTGVGPTRIGTVIGVTKAYVTRVGEGPFPTEIHDAAGEALRARGQEYGAVTGRPRRCGWLDLPLLRYSNMINGTEWLVVTKMDVLDEWTRFPSAPATRSTARPATSSPPTSAALKQSSPSTPASRAGSLPPKGIRNFDDLPKPAQEYLRFMEKETGAKIGIVSTGPDREQTLEMPEFRESMRRIAGK